MKNQNEKLLVHALAAKTGGGTTYLLSFAQQFLDCQKPLKVVFLLSKDVALPNSKFIEKKIMKWAGKNWLHRIIFDQFYLPIYLFFNPKTKLYCFGNFAPAWGPKSTVVLIQNAKYYDPEFLGREIPRKRFIAKVQGIIAWLGARHSLSVHFPTCTMKNLAEKKHPNLALKSRVNHFGVNTELTKYHDSGLFHEKKQQKKPITFIYVMNYTLQKNVTYLLQALTLAKFSNIDVCVILTSKLNPGPKSCYTKDWNIIRSENLIDSGYLKLLGPVLGKDLYQLYEKSTGSVFPSFCEAFGHPLIETMLMEKPLLCADRGYSRELCGPHALYFNPTVPQELVEIWRNWPESLNDWSPASKDYIKARFNWGKHTESILEDLIY